MVRSFLKRLLTKPFRMARGAGSGDEHGGSGAAAPGRAPADDFPAPASATAPPLPEPDADGFVAVCTSANLAVGKPLQAEVTGSGAARTVAVFRTEEGVFCTDNACLHEDGPLGEGRVIGNVVTCPYHDWRYDVRDGSCLSRKGRKLATYEVRERDAHVWVGPARTGGTAARGGEHDDGLAQRKAT